MSAFIAQETFPKYIRVAYQILAKGQQFGFLTLNWKNVGKVPET
jgi:hypothetical protein